MWLIPAGCLQNNLVCMDRQHRAHVLKAVSLCRKGVHACGRQQEPAPQLSSNTNAGEAEKRSPVTCAVHLVLDPARAGHVCCVLHNREPSFRRTVTYTYRVTNKEGLCEEPESGIAEGFSHFFGGQQTGMEIEIIF